MCKMCKVCKSIWYVRDLVHRDFLYEMQILSRFHLIYFPDSVLAIYYYFCSTITFFLTIFKGEKIITQKCYKLLIALVMRVVRKRSKPNDYQSHLMTPKCLLLLKFIVILRTRKTVGCSFSLLCFIFWHASSMQDVWTSYPSLLLRNVTVKKSTKST